MPLLEKKVEMLNNYVVTWINHGNVKQKHFIYEQYLRRLCLGSKCKIQSSY